MSRSYKLIFETDERKVKRQKHHRAYRRHVHQEIQKWMKSQEKYDKWIDILYEVDLFDIYDEEKEIKVYVRDYQDLYPEPSFKHPYQITHPYDICDWYWGYWNYRGNKEVHGHHRVKGKPNRIAK